MRRIVWIALSLSVGWLGCTLDTEGTGGQFPPGSGGTGGTATGGTGGTATGGTGGTATGGTGGTVGPEDCTNGTDDNGDSLVDCADPQCTPDYQCEIAPPSGWSNVGYKAERAIDAPATDCSGFDALEFKRDLTTPTTGCSCSCGEPDGESCEIQTNSLIWSNQSCSGLYAQVTVNTCQSYPSDWTIASVDKGTFTYTQGTCSAQSTGTPGPSEWTGAVDVCLVSQQGGGCAIGSVCVKKPTAVVNPAACVHQSGNVACPAAYPQQNIYHDGIDDNRTCSASACSCGAANGSCNAVVALHDNTNCSGSPKGVYPLDGTCQNTGFNQGAIRSGRVTGSINVGTCPPSGTGMTGTATPTGPHTVCCVAP